MSSIDNQDAAGDLICVSEFTDVPNWGLYLLSLLATSFGIIILAVSVPLLFGNRQGDFTGGAAGSTIGLILMAAGIGAFVSARGQGSLRHRFHDNGIFAGRGTDLAFIPYDTLDDIIVEIQEPSATTKALSIARGTLSLAVGNAAGVGWAGAKLKSRGFVHYRVAENQEYTTVGCDFADAERVGWHLEKKFDLPIIKRTSV